MLIASIESTSHEADENGTVTIDVGQVIDFATEVANERPDKEDCDVAKTVLSLLGSVVELFVDGSSMGTADTTYSTPVLEEGTSHTQPNGLTFNVPGEYELTHYADYTNAVKECNEDNNWAAVFDRLDWIIELFGKNESLTPMYRITVIDSQPASAEKQAQYQMLIDNKQFVTFH